MIIILTVVLGTLALIPLSIFLVTLLYVKDIYMALVIFINEIYDYVRYGKKRKIDYYAKIVTDSLKKELRRITKLKDSELAKELSISESRARKIKKRANLILEEKYELLISRKTVETLLESTDQLSFIGSYRSSVEVYSNPERVKNFKDKVNNKKKLTKNSYQSLEKDEIMKQIKPSEMFKSYWDEDDKGHLAF